MTKLIINLCLFTILTGCPIEGHHYAKRLFPVTIKIINKTSTTIKHISISNPEIGYGSGKINISPEKVYTDRIQVREYNAIIKGNYVLRYSTTEGLNRKIDGSQLVIKSVQNEKEWSVTIIIDK